MPKSLTIRTLSSTEILVDGESVSGFDSRKVTAILIYLACSRRTFLREVLAEFFWEGRTQSQALANLRVALSSLRKSLGEFVDITRDSVELKSDTEVVLDVATFEEALAAGNVERAIDLYQGDFLEGFYVDSDGFEAWATQVRERLRLTVQEALDAIITRCLETGDYRQGVTRANQLLAMDTLREKTHRQLMLLLAHSDEREAALEQYKRCRQLLADELGVEPTAETTTLYEQIRAGEVRQARPAPTVESLPRRPRHNLPPQPTSFVGREQEIADITALLEQATCRLLTLVGPGGIGKTRLALEVARQQTDAFADGVFVTELAPLTAADNIVPTVATALGFQFMQSNGSPDDKTPSPQQQLLNFLREKHVLLVMDNFEHLLDGANLLDAILNTAQHVRVLVTSREVLNLQRETVFDVVGLSYPTNGDTADAASFSGVQLFQARAQRIQRHFSLEHEQAHVTRICQLVAGMPLGIELAASWLRVLNCEQLAAELQRNLADLTHRRTADARHQSLRAVFEHSWKLLDSLEQQVLERLTVFHGAFSREAAQAVADASLEVLSALADKSMLRINASGQYDLHEIIRQQAAEKLAADPAAQTDALDRHMAYYCAFLEARLAELKGAFMREALDAIEATLPNVSAAWDRAIRTTNASLALQAFEGLFYFYYYRGNRTSGKATFETAINEWQKAVTNSGTHKTVLAALYGASGGLEGIQRQGIDHLRTSVNMLRGSQHDRVLAFSMQKLARALNDTEQPDKADEATGLLVEAQALYTRLEDPFEIARTLRFMGLSPEHNKTMSKHDAILKQVLPPRNPLATLD